MVRVEGVGKVLRALKRKKMLTEKGVESGLKQAGLFVKRESQKIVPVKTTNLKGTANTRHEHSGFDTVVFVTYGTDYALFVHEDLEARHKEGKTARYLQRILEERADDIKRIIRSKAKRN